MQKKCHCLPSGQCLLRRLVSGTKALRPCSNDGESREDIKVAHMAVPVGEDYPPPLGQFLRQKLSGAIFCRDGAIRARSF